MNGANVVPQRLGDVVVMTMKSSAAALLVMAALAGCAPQVTQHGHTIDPESLSRITPGVTSREEVVRLLGSPSALATFEDGRWYYVTQRRESRSFYQSEITDQDVVTIAFDDRGIVQDVSKHGKDQATAVDPDPDATRTLGNEMTFVEQLIGNIGRFGDPSTGPGPLPE
jgi:outer membrane protein assembly factor BamE (lipoprotein component of BamABCDE complex)